MTSSDETLLSAHQLDSLQIALHHGATEAAEAMHRWTGKPVRIESAAVEQLPLEEATTVLGNTEETICFCSIEMSGLLTGQILFAFDDASGLQLADLLLDQPGGTSATWGDMEESAALETTNILCCAYLNAVARVFPPTSAECDELLPSPPRFSREFAGSLLEFAVMGQIVTCDHVLMVHTRFHIDGSPQNWTLLIVPDAASMVELREVLQ